MKIVGRFGMLILMLCGFSPVFSQVDVTNSGLEEPMDTLDILTPKGTGYGMTDVELKERLSALTSCVDLRINGVVRGYIKTYVQLKTDKARNMLGKRLTYFPLYEEKFKEYGLPDDLKFLSVVESALNPKAVSRVGATGLWQFMPTTGSEYGLRTNSAVEDRSNPVKSTDAAARHLRDLYKQFNDWSLALAAYNSGAGRVNAAIRRCGSRNFWQIQRFLPEETRNYVPAFIAATYICNYFQLHGLDPVVPDLDQQITNYIKVHEGISFRDIADATGISYSVIKELNPGFKRDYVPPTNDGHYVIVPHRVMPAFVRYLNSISSARQYVLDNPEDYTSPDAGDGRYWKSNVKIREGLSLSEYSNRLGICADQIKTWNNLTSNYLQPGQALILYRPVFVQKHSSIRIDAPDAAPKPKAQIQSTGQKKSEPGSTTKPAAGNQVATTTVTPAVKREVVTQFHTIRRNESLEDIARLYSTSVASIRKYNDCSNLKFGMRLKIREF